MSAPAMTGVEVEEVVEAPVDTALLRACVETGIDGLGLHRGRSRRLNVRG